MTKLPPRGPMPSMLLALLSLGIMPMPSLRAVRIAISGANSTDAAVASDD